MSHVRATVLQLSLDLQLRTLKLSRYARSKRILHLCTAANRRIFDQMMKCVLVSTQNDETASYEARRVMR